MYAWVDLIINGMLAFNIVQNKVFRRNFKQKPTSLSSLMRILPKLTQVVEEKISSTLPDDIALIFDGWSASSTHYIALFASFPVNNELRYSTRLLSFSPLEDDSNLNAEEHISFMNYVLDLYGKSCSNVRALIDDNATVNRSISSKTDIPLIGCSSHRFNLAVNDILTSYEQILGKINRLMVKLRSLTISARLRKFTHLGPKLRNVT